MDAIQFKLLRSKCMCSCYTLRKFTIRHDPTNGTYCEAIQLSTQKVNISRRRDHCQGQKEWEINMIWWVDCDVPSSSFENQAEERFCGRFAMTRARMCCHLSHHSIIIDLLIWSDFGIEPQLAPMPSLSALQISHCGGRDKHSEKLEKDASQGPPFTCDIRSDVD